MLLEAGAEADIRDRSGLTSLHRAATLGLVRKIDILLLHWAHLQAKDQKGLTALDVATANGHAAAVRRLQASRGEDGATPKGGTLPWQVAGNTVGEMLKSLMGC
jgi:ankyrin repeat protein